MEARLNHKKKYLEDRIAKKKLEKKETVHEIVNLSSEIENLHVEIQYLVNYVKYADQEEKDRINMTSLNRKGGRYNSNDDEVFTVMSILQVNHNIYQIYLLINFISYLSVVLERSKEERRRRQNEGKRNRVEENDEREEERKSE